MALTVGENSYVTVSEADDYFSENRLFCDAWDNADSTTKEKALIMAARAIDGLMIAGQKTDTSQIMQFPRTLWTSASNLYYTQANVINTFSQYPGYEVESEVPQKIKDAQCEEALAIIENGGKGNRQKLQYQGVKSISVSKSGETYSKSKSKLLSAEAYEFMRGYLL